MMLVMWLFMVVCMSELLGVVCMVVVCCRWLMKVMVIMVWWFEGWVVSS